MWYVLQTDGTGGILAGTVLGCGPSRRHAITAAVAEYVHQSDGLVQETCTFGELVDQCNAEGMQIVVYHHG